MSLDTHIDWISPNCPFSALVSSLPNRLVCHWVVAPLKRRVIGLIQSLKGFLSQMEHECFCERKADSDPAGSHQPFESCASGRRLNNVISLLALLGLLDKNIVLAASLILFS